MKGTHSQYHLAVADGSTFITAQATEEADPSATAKWYRLFTLSCAGGAIR